MLTVMDERFTANDLTRVIMLNSNKKKKDENKLSPQDRAFHEKRQRRKIRKLDFEIKEGDRIAQLVLERCETLPIRELESLEETDRGSGGFGSTGV